MITYGRSSPIKEMDVELDSKVNEEKRKVMERIREEN